MYKNFIQLLLSLVVGVSVGVGFSPEMKERVTKTLREGKTIAQEITESILNTSKLDTDAEFSTEGSIEASMDTDVKGKAKSETEADIELELDLNHISETLSAINGETSLSAEAETNAEIQSNDAKLDLETEIESQLDLDVGIGN
jgi:hypothetical protein